AGCADACRAWPRCGSACLAGQRGLHPETRFRPAGRQAPAGLRCAPARRSFFKSLLCLKVALRVHGTPRHAAEIQLLQQLADAALMQMNMEFGGDAVPQVSTAPAHHAIGLEVRTALHPLGHLTPLGLGGARPKAPPSHPRCSEKPSRAASAGPCHRPARPTAANDHPAPWQWPECAASAWRQPSAPPPPATAKYSDFGV